MLFVLFAAIAVNIRNVQRYKYINKVIVLEKKINNPVLRVMRKNIPTKIARKDISRWIWVLIVLFIWLIFRSFAMRLSIRAKSCAIKKYLADLKVEPGAPAQVSDLIDNMHKKFAEIQHSKSSDRKELLKQFVKLKKTLDETGRHLAFLAIDVVDSTGMKAGEDKKIVEYDFMEYNNLVDKVLDSYGCLNSSWTPDGVMACFASVEAAVQAARKIITSLDDFNRNIKQMQKDFAVRCGINAGLVYYDINTPLESFSDQVIDIAGHMQKSAAPNTICIAKQAIEPVIEKEGFKMAGRKIDGVDVYEWKA
jgi:class 3 adenylate cyclase/uncharacterized protein YggT (Ycf19 family)